MAYYLSPVVAIQESDGSATVAASSTSTGVIVLENTEKGKEFVKTLITDTDSLVNTFGNPTSNEKNYLSMLTAAVALNNMSSLYCTAVKPADATYAGLYTVPNEDTTLSDSIIQLDSDLEDTTVRSYNLLSFNASDIDEFSEEVYPDGFADFIAVSRGAWANRIRIALVSYEMYNNIIRNQDADSIAECEFAQEIASLDMPLDTEYDFILMVSYLKDTTLDESLSSSGELVEAFSVSTKETATDSSGDSKFIEQQILNSSYIRLALNEFQKNSPFTQTYNTWLRFGGGSNGTTTSDLDSEIITAYNLYNNAEEIDVNIFIDGGKSETVKRELISICESRGDCMCILDVPKDIVRYNSGYEVTDMVNWRKGLDKYADGNNLNESSDKAALYGNWCEVYDQWNVRYRWIPASGLAAAVGAYTDSSTEPWYAPAGNSRATLTSVRSLAFNPKLSERDLMYSSGINPVVSFPADGKVIWGQKTMLDSTSSFNRINVRRLFLVIEKAISEYVRQYLFEPNDAFTRNLIVSTIVPYLKDIQSRRGIAEYNVVCDESNNTATRIDNSELWCDIMVKPIRAAEFIILRFSNVSNILSFSEITLDS